MTALNAFATSGDELDNMVSKGGFDHRGNLSGFEAKGYSFKFWNHIPSPKEAELTPLPGGSRILGIQDGQGGKGLALEYAFTQSLDFVHGQGSVFESGLGFDHQLPNLDFGRNQGQAVEGDFGKVSFHFGRGNLNIGSDFVPHLLRQ